MYFVNKPGVATISIKFNNAVSSVNNELLNTPPYVH